MIFYCRSGVRAQTAVDLAKAAGYKLSVPCCREASRRPRSVLGAFSKLLFGPSGPPW